MKLYGLIGYPLSHSFSEKYFKEKFRKENIQGADYRSFPIQHLNELQELRNQNPELAGFNVTIPYKKEIIKYMDDIDSEAKAIGAVNCVNLSGNKLGGYNTDHIGFSKSLSPLLSENTSHALILGGGGAAGAVRYALEKMNITTAIVSRKAIEGAISYENISKSIMEKHLLIVNTTPLGMYPNSGNFPSIPYEYLTTNHICYDLIYNPEKTQFLLKAQQQGANIKNGLEMLELQAEASWEIWNQTK